MTDSTRSWGPAADLQGEVVAKLRKQAGGGEIWSDGIAVAVVTEAAGGTIALVSEDVAPAPAARLAADLTAAGRPARLAFADARSASAGLEPAGKATLPGGAFEAFRLPDHRHEIAHNAPTQPQTEDLAGRARWFSTRFGPTS